MAKKAETISLIDTFAEFKESMNIERATFVSVLEESFRSVIAKLFGSDDNYDVIVNPDKGDFEIYRNRTVVADGEVKDGNREISLTEARQIDEDYEVGEEVSENVDFAGFGRRAILTLRQTLASKILELEHDSLYNKYKDRVGEIVSANEVLLGDAFLPKEIYFISNMPSDPRLSDIVPIAICSLVLSLAATLYPSWRAARTQPAEALRYE